MITQLSSIMHQGRYRKEYFHLNNVINIIYIFKDCTMYILGNNFFSLILNELAHNNNNNEYKQMRRRLCMSVC